MSTDATIKAFNIGANGNAIDIRLLIVSLVFAALFSVCIYILLNAYDELKSRKVKFTQFNKTVFRVIFFIMILGYFLLH